MSEFYQEAHDELEETIDRLLMHLYGRNPIGHEADLAEEFESALKDLGTSLVLRLKTALECYRHEKYMDAAFSEIAEARMIQRMEECAA